MRETLCLCHGGCGNFLILDKYFRLYKDAVVLDICKEGPEYVANRVVRGSGVEMQKEYGVNIMNGHAGVLFYLLQSNLDIL